MQRVWLVLEEKGIPYQYIEVNPYHKPAELLRCNPRGLVPTLEVSLGGGTRGGGGGDATTTTTRPLYESTVLVEFLEDAYPDHGPALRPPGGAAADHVARARLRIWVDYVGTRVIPAFHRFLQFQPGGGDGGAEGARKLEQLRGEYRDTLLGFAREIDDDGPYFLGECTA